MKRSRYIQLSTFPLLTLGLVACDHPKTKNPVCISVLQCHKEYNFSDQQCQTFFNSALTTHKENDYIDRFAEMRDCEYIFGEHNCYLAKPKLYVSEFAQLVAKPKMAAFQILSPLDEQGSHVAIPLYFNQKNRQFVRQDGEVVQREGFARHHYFWPVGS